MSSNILFASSSYDKYDASVTLPAKFDRLLDQTGLDNIVKDKVTAIKMHVGRGIGYTTIHPLFVKSLVDKLKKWGAKVYITDQEVDGARNRGYTEELLGAPILAACGFTEKYFYEKKVSYKTLKDIDIAGYIHDADVMIDLSHIKGHGSCGFGGSVKNIAMGCVTTRTRQQIHGLEGFLEWDEKKCDHCELCINSCNHSANSFKDDKYTVFYHHCTICQHCTKVCPNGALTLNGDEYDSFQKGMAICTKEVLDIFEPNNVYYISFLTNITALCDCWGLTTPSLVPDIGIMASNDIIAIERACLDAIKTEDLLVSGIPEGFELGTKGHLFERLHVRDPFVQLEELKKLSLGSDEYKLNEIK